MKLTELRGVELRKAITRTEPAEVLNQLTLSKRAIGVGSGRKVYSVKEDDILLVKKAYNLCGVYQLNTEISIYNDVKNNSSFEEMKRVLPFIYTGQVEYDERRAPKDFSTSFIVMQKLKQLKYEKGTISITAVCSQYGIAPMEMELIIRMFVKKYKLLPGDMYDASHWGLTPKGKLKLLDFGTTEEIYNRFYHD